MEKLLKPGRIIFATGMIALGILCFLLKDFIVGRPPAWSADFDLNPLLAYISGSLLIITAIAILLNKKPVTAALLIAALILCLSVSRHIPHFMNDWANAYKTMALLGSAFIIGASFLNANNNAGLINSLLVAGSILLAAFFIIAGYAHFKYAGFVDTLIPSFIPFHRFWTYTCGAFLFAGGVGLFIPPVKKWAAFLSGIMVAGWFVLLHIPRFLADTNNVNDRLGLFESFTFAGAFFVLAAMFARKKTAA